MDRLDAMTLFVAAVDGGSLAAAARRHGRSAASVTRAVALLEREAGEPLLLRSTRKLGVTPAGERHLETWREVLVRLADLAPAAAGTTLRGTVRMTTPEVFGRLHVLPLTEDFVRAHPLVSLRLTLRNTIVDLIGSGIDLAVRFAPLPDSGLVATRIGEVRSLVCAAPDYLDHAGVPVSPVELDRHACIGLDADAQAERWTFAPPTGRPRTVRITPQLSVDHAASGIDVALRGHGIVRVRSYQVAEHLVSGRLVRLMPQWEPPPIPAHVVFPVQRSLGAASRAMVDHLVPALRRRLLKIEATVESSS